MMATTLVAHTAPSNVRAINQSDQAPINKRASQHLDEVLPLLHGARLFPGHGRSSRPAPTCQPCRRSAVSGMSPVRTTLQLVDRQPTGNSCARTLQVKQYRESEGYRPATRRLYVSLNKDPHFTLAIPNSESWPLGNNPRQHERAQPKRPLPIDFGGPRECLSRYQVLHRGVLVAGVYCFDMTTKHINCLALQRGQYHFIYFHGELDGCGATYTLSSPFPASKTFISSCLTISSFSSTVISTG